MYFDTLTFNAVVDELRHAILGGRIQRVILPNELSVALEVYANRQRHHVLLSAHPQFARVHLSETRPSRGVQAESPLLLLLRKYILGGRIVALEQPDLERVMVLSIAKGALSRNVTDDDEMITDEEAPNEEVMEQEFLSSDTLSRTELVIEVVERRSNIILVKDDNIILECVRHIAPAMSRRPLQPREPYELPPRQQKRDPRHATAEGLIEAHEQAQQDDLARLMVQTYRGVSPQLAREVVYRCLKQSKISLTPDLPWEQLATALQSIWNIPAEPCVAVGETGPVAFAPYILTHYDQVEPQAGISRAVERYYMSREHFSDHQQRRAALEEVLGEKRKRLQRQQSQLEGELERAKELEHLRWEGEMIFAFLHAIESQQTTLEVDGHTITLNPKNTPVEEAQARFKSYDKAKGALENVPERLQETEAMLAGLDELQALLSVAESFEQIEDISREAIELGYIHPPKGKNKTPKVRRQKPLRLISEDGYIIYAGRSVSQNEQVTFKLANPDDLWLHVQGIPGAHVIIKSDGQEVPERTLHEAASLAAYFSQARTDVAVDVDVSHRRLVRRVRRGPPGLVTYRAEQTLRVAPRGP